MKNSRGIVLSPPFEILENGGIICGGSPNPADIRKYLLYWDEIDYPDNNFISVGACQDIQFLIDAKIASRTRVQFQGSLSSNNGEVFIKAQQAVFDKRQKESPGNWSLAQQSTAPHFIGGQSKTAIDYELWNALPVPKKDVPLNDILEFKDRRMPELIALRIHLDELYQQIISSSDIPRARNTAVAKLESSLSAIDRTMAEKLFPRELTSLRGFIPLAVESFLAGGLGMMGASSQLGMEPFSASVVGSCLYFSVKTLSLPSNISSSAALTYVSGIKRDL